MLAVANGSIFGGSSDAPIAAFNGVSPNDGVLSPTYLPCVRMVLFWSLDNSLILSSAACVVVAFNVPPISGVSSKESPSFETIFLLGLSSSTCGSSFACSILANFSSAILADSSCFSFAVCSATSSTSPFFSWLIDRVPSTCSVSISSSTISSVLPPGASSFSGDFSSIFSIFCGLSSTSLSAIFETTNCWFAPAAISSAAVVITFDDVFPLLNLSVTATIPVSKAVAICSSRVTFGVFRSSSNSTTISLTPLALDSCQSTEPRPLFMSPAVIATTVASCKILPCAVKAVSILSLFSTFSAKTSSTL